MMQNNFVGECLDFHKKVFDLWQESMNNMDPRVKVDEKATNIFEESLKPIQEITRKWVQFSNEFYTQNIKSFNNDAYLAQQEIINKMLNGANLYQNLNKFWEDLNLNMSGKNSDPFDFYSKWNQDYMKIVSNSFISFLPDSMRSLVNEALEIYEMSTDTSNKFFRPWLDEAQNLQCLWAKSMTGDQGAYIEFNKLWQSNFDASFGKIFNMPQFSMNRELIQNQMLTMNALINFINNMSEFMATMAMINQDTLENILNDYQEMLIAGNNPKTYKEFYEYWWKKNETAYLRVFATNEFSKLLAQVLEASVNFKKEFDNLLEKQLKFLPYPTKTDMDSVYKTLDALKREVRALKREAAARNAEEKSVKED